MPQRHLAVMFGVLLGCSAVPGFATPAPDSPAAKREAQMLNQLPPVAPHGRAPIDRSGRTQKGHASFYARWFSHRKMADGQKMNPNADVAASKNLPLGTTAKVTNLENGKSATVKIEDRGPYAGARVVDLSPKVAGQLDIKKEGVVPVEVKPIAVPQPDGQVKLGAGAAEASPQEVREATETTEGLVDRHGTETISRR